jgi:hypothetical protein
MSKIEGDTSHATFYRLAFFLRRTIWVCLEADPEKGDSSSSFVIGLATTLPNAQPFQEIGKLHGFP